MADVNGTPLDGAAIKAVAQIVKANATPITTETIHGIIVPKDCDLRSLKDLQYPDGIRPSRIIGTVSLRDAVSFIKYYQAFADDRSRIFGEPANQSFLAILDYHGAGERQPEFLSHRAAFQMVLDDRWKTWSSKSEKQFAQSDFADFIEDNNADILEPSGAHMLEVARDLKASMGANFESKVTPKNGQIHMRYTEQIDGKVGTGGLEVPEFFKLSIPVFYGEEPITISARLRYRIQQGSLTFHYKLYRQTEILNAAFDKAAASISEALKVDILRGSPA